MEWGIVVAMRRVRSFLWFVVGVAALAAAAWFALGDRGDEVTAPAVPTTSAAPSGGWTVAHVADGDTFDALGPEGRRTIRIGGINAPEQGECGADEAREALRVALGTGPLTLVRDRTDRDDFGRLVRYVELADGTDVGAELVRQGWALSRRYWPDRARNDTYDELQRVARAEGLGQWSVEGCGATVPDVSISVEINADPPGRDDEHLGDEWVRFRNDAATPIDLDGWTVADESSSNRYRFVGLGLAPGASVTLFTGCGVDDAVNRYWCTDGYPVWNNDGDTVFLRDPSGTDVLAVGY